VKRTGAALLILGAGVASAVMIAADPRTEPPIERGTVNSVTSFASNHPEWALLRAERVDESGLKFNHQWHMDLGADKGGPLACVDCHEIDDAGRYMKPITFVDHCARCHGAGGVSDRLGEAKVAGADWVEPAPIPHGSVADAWRLITAQHGAAVALNPKQYAEADVSEDEAEEEASSGRGRGRSRGRGRGASSAPSDEGVARFDDPAKAGEWITAESRSRLDRVLRSGCQSCHAVEEVENPEPDAPGVRIAPVNVPQVWLPRSVFSHDAHAMMSCEDCHSEVAESPFTGDIHIPGIDSCRECHVPAVGAPSSCVTCHLYHQRPQTQVQGWLSTADLTGASETPAGEPTGADAPSSDGEGAE